MRWLICEIRKSFSYRIYYRNACVNANCVDPGGTLVPLLWDVRRNGFREFYVMKDFLKETDTLKTSNPWANSADNKLIFFYFYPRKLDLAFHANCLQWRQFAWNVKSCFLRKNQKKKKNQYVVCWNFYPEWISVNRYFWFCKRRTPRNVFSLLFSLDIMLNTLMTF